MTKPEPIATRPLGKKEALDQALAEAVERLRNEPTVAESCFAAMKETIAAAPDSACCCYMLKKLVATALASWTPPTADGVAFAAAAAKAGFLTATYGKTTTVVREAAYPTTLGPDRALMKNLCRQFNSEVLKPSLAKLRSFKKLAPDERAFADHLRELVRAGSLEAPSTPKLLPAPRFTID